MKAGIKFGSLKFQEKTYARIWLQTWNWQKLKDLGHTRVEITRNIGLVPMRQSLIIPVTLKNNR